MTTVRYSLDVIRDEARQLVNKGLVYRQQQIYTLCQYILASDNTFAKKRPENVCPVKRFLTGESNFCAILEFIQVKYQ